MGKDAGGLTVTISVMRCHLLPNTDWLDDSKGDVTPFAEQFDIVIAIMLSKGRCLALLMERKKRRLGGEKKNCTYIDEARGAQKEMVLFQLLGVNNTEITSNPDAVRVSLVSPLQLPFFFFC